MGNPEVNLLIKNAQYQSLEGTVILPPPSLQGYWSSIVLEDVSVWPKQKWLQVTSYIDRGSLLGIYLLKCLLQGLFFCNYWSWVLSTVIRDWRASWWQYIHQLWQVTFNEIFPFVIEKKIKDTESSISFSPAARWSLTVNTELLSTELFPVPITNWRRSVIMPQGDQ